MEEKRKSHCFGGKARKEETTKKTYTHMGEK
jgi:hypothetical protein